VYKFKSRVEEEKADEMEDLKSFYKNNTRTALDQHFYGFFDHQKEEMPTLVHSPNKKKKKIAVQPVS